MDTDRIRVLFIGGYSRSGSTLLDRLLGQVDGFFSAGELRHIWDGGFGENQLCGCGKPFRECEFWRAVVHEAFGGFDRVDVGDIMALKHSIDRARYIPQMISSRRTSGYKERFERYSNMLGKLYAAIQRISGSRVIVDSSKNATHGFVLNAMPQVDLYVVHLVRDSRATAFSWQRKKLNPAIQGGTSYMPTFGPPRTALRWNIQNGLAHMLRFVNPHYQLHRYEDCLRDPRAALSSVLALLGEGRPNLDFLSGNTATLQINHTVSGNPIRFQQGVVELRSDREWETKMVRLHKYLVAALTLPLLLSYGYLRK